MKGEINGFYPYLLYIQQRNEYRNPSRVILIFSGQKLCTRIIIIQTISHSFLHFFKGLLPAITPETIYHGEPE